MDDPRATPPGPSGPGESSPITGVEKVTYAEGSGYGFSLLDEESKKPCFRLVFETAEDAEEGRSMMAEIIEHALWYEVPDGA
jgi:hypothetical protein